MSMAADIQTKAQAMNRVLSDISQAINETVVLDDLFGKIHLSLGKIIDTTNFFIARYSPLENTVTFAYHVDSEELPNRFTAFDLNTIKGSLTELVITSGKPQLMTREAVIDYRRQNNYPQFGKTSAVWLGVPLRVKGSVTGVIAVQNYHDPLAYREEDVRLLSTVSDQVALAIELKTKEDALKKSEQQFRNLVEGIREVIYLTDAQGGITYISPAAEAMIGFPATEITATTGYFRYRQHAIIDQRQGFDRFIHPEHRATVEETISAALERIEPFQIEYRLLNANGTSHWVFEKGQFFKDESGVVRLEGIILNIQERKRAEMINQALYNISNAVNTTSDLDDLYQSIHRSLGLVLNVENFYIALYDAKNDIITFPYIRDRYDKDIAPIHGVRHSTSLTGVVIRTAKPLLLTKAESFALVNQLGGSHIGHPPEFWLGVPLKIKSEVIGATVLQSYDPNTCYSETDSEILISVSEQIANAIERKQAEVELAETQNRLIASAHKAGMAEIASGTLHNVGNILNSVKVSADIINSINRESSFFLYKKANDLLRSQFTDLDNFILHNPKGKQLLEYYLRLETAFESENRQIQEQIWRLHDKIQLMTDVIFDQQTYAASGLMITEHTADELIDSVLKMQADMLSKHHIHIIKRFNPAYKILVQKTKFMHVLINLFKNAKDSLLNQPEDNRKLTVCVNQADTMVHICISDNGEGIPDEVRGQLFNHGFTTKTDGHGFGLHNSITYMKEMQGDILVASDGPGKGATFTVTVPCVRY